MVRSHQSRCRQFVATAGAVLLLSGCFGGTTVELINVSPQALQNVSVAFTGGATPPISVPPGGEATLHLKPTGESRLVIGYQTPHGQKHCRVDTYLEPDYRAHFRVELHARSCSVTKQEIRLRFWMRDRSTQPVQTVHSG